MYFPGPRFLGAYCEALVESSFAPVCSREYSPGKMKRPSSFTAFNIWLYSRLRSAEAYTDSETLEYNGIPEMNRLGHPFLGPFQESKLLKLKKQPKYLIDSRMQLFKMLVELVQRYRRTLRTWANISKTYPSDWRRNLRKRASNHNFSNFRSFIQNILQNTTAFWYVWGDILVG